MCHCRAKYLLIALLCLPGFYVAAQTTTVSNPRNGRENNPYTKFGIGELQNGNNTVLKGMGNITSAYAHPTQVNTDNPASYTFLTRTTFEAGATASTRSIDGTIDGTGVTYKTGTASLSYLNIAFPINKKGGVVLGFRPYSHVYYSLADTITSAGIGQTIRSYNGDGALNYAFVGGAAKIVKGLSIGFNLGYMFGTIRNTTGVIPMNTISTNYGYYAEYSDYTRIGGLQWKGGAMYEAKLDSFHTLRVGGTLALGQNLTERLNSFQISSFGFGDTTVRDTVYNSGELKGKLQLPTTFSIGVMLGRTDKWSVGVDYTATNWSTFSSQPDSARNTGIADNAYKISVGGEYTPDINSVTSYFAKATYRMGLYYGTDYLKLSNTTLPYYGFTLGTSLPFRRSLSRVHLALDAGRLGTTDNSLLKQTYFRLSVGMSFNDLWFIKRKYE